MLSFMCSRFPLVQQMAFKACRSNVTLLVYDKHCSKFHNLYILLLSHCTFSVIAQQKQKNTNQLIRNYKPKLNLIYCYNYTLYNIYRKTHFPPLIWFFCTTKRADKQTAQSHWPHDLTINPLFLSTGGMVD